MSVRFQSTLPARGATWIDWNNSERLKQFQSTLPARGATTGSSSTSMRRRLFQSTLPARGATMLSLTRFSSKSHFNPRSPHGERREQVRLIHAPFYFNPRSPHGERHNQRRAARGRKYISIHAPRTGSDGIVMPQGRTRGDFNPRSPHGERPSRASRTASGQQFQSTLPARGATPKKVVS